MSQTPPNNGPLHSSLSTPRPNRSRNPLNRTADTDAEVKKMNDQYNHRIYTLMVEDWEKKSGAKLNRDPDLEEADPADTQTPDNTTSCETAAKPKNQTKQQTVNKEQAAYGSAEWKAKNEKLVKMSKAEEDEMNAFWSS